MSDKPMPVAAGRGAANFKLLQRALRLASDLSLNGLPEDVVFVCIDCETFESDHDKILEIGVAVLDTKNLRECAPGENGEAWLSKLQCAHYRVLENASLVNRRFVKGRPDAFHFGTSSWITLENIKQVLERIFLNPGELARAAEFDHEILDALRHVVLVGHGLGNDLDFLKKAGSPSTELPNLARTMDTQSFLGTKRKPISLKLLLLAVGLKPQDLHNAGNDATYTLQALILLAVKETGAPGSVVAKVDELRAVVGPNKRKRAVPSQPAVENVKNSDPTAGCTPEQSANKVRSSG